MLTLAVLVVLVGSVVYSQGGPGHLWVALSDGTKFGPDGFGYTGKWLDSKCIGTGDVKAFGDYNGDDKTDFLCWQASTGNFYVALSDGTKFGPDGFGYTGMWLGGKCSGGADVKAFSDYNGDSATDVLCWEASTGDTYVALSDGTKFGPGADAWTGRWLQSKCTGPGDTKYFGDFNGDSMTDFLCWQGSTGHLWVALSDGTKFGPDELAYTGKWLDSKCLGTGDVKAFGDYNGDDLTDFLCWEAATGHLWVALSDGTKFGPDGVSYSGKWLDSKCRGAGDVKAFGDYNRDTMVDFLCWEASTGHLWVALSDGTKFGPDGFSYSGKWLDSKCLGPGDTKYFGDYNGDTMTDFLCWQGSTGHLFVALSDGTKFGPDGFSYTGKWLDSKCLGSGAIKAFGDYNGDAMTDFLCWDGNGGAVLFDDHLQRRPRRAVQMTGRQLFVDEYLIEKKSGLTREYYPATKVSTPVLSPQFDWEGNGAMVFSDGVFWEPAEQQYRAWYMCNVDRPAFPRQVCLAVSSDGIAFQKPLWNGTNNVVLTPAPGQDNRDSAAVVRDLTDPIQKWKLLYSYPSPGSAPHALTLYGSVDGKAWDTIGQSSELVGDRTTGYFDPFRQQFVWSIRAGAVVQGFNVRARRYAASTTFTGSWSSQPWANADRHDVPKTTSMSELYNLDATPYESLMVGLFSIFRGDRDPQPKFNDVVVAFSRDGFHWFRPMDRTPLIKEGDPGAWDEGNVQSAGGGLTVHGDELRVYYSGRKRDDSEYGRRVCYTGVAWLRRDGFASLDAAPGGGQLTTRRLSFDGQEGRNQLWVNAETTDLRVDILSEDGSVVYATSSPVSGTATRMAVVFPGLSDLSQYAGTRLRYRFRLANGKLYSFWIGDSIGRSGGYLGAGGPEANAQYRDAQ